MYLTEIFASYFVFICTIFELIKGLGFTLGSFFVMCGRFFDVGRGFLFEFFWHPQS